MSQNVIIEGRTAPVFYALTEGSGAFVGTGYDIAVLLFSTNDEETPIDPSPLEATWDNAGTGRVKVTGWGTVAPDSYTIRFAISNGSGLDYIPNGQSGLPQYVVRRGAKP